MSIEKYRQQHGTITIPDPYGRGGYEQRIAVEPLGDTWLVAKERRWEDVDKVLNGRLQDIQIALTSSDAYQSYGIERPLNQPKATVLSYAILLDEYHRATHDHQQRAVHYRQAYEETKAQILRGPGKNGRKQQRIKQTFTSDYSPKINFHSQRSQETERVQELILKKTVVDLISYQRTEALKAPLITNNFTELITDLTETSEPARESLFYLLDTLSDYMRHTADVELLHRFAYKPTKDLISKPYDAQLLDTMLQFYFQTHLHEVPIEIQSKLEQLSHAFFSFLKHRGENQYPENGTYPLLELPYDTYSVALFRGDLSMLNGMNELVDTYFLEYFQTKKGKNEITRCFDSWRKQLHPDLIDLKLFRADALLAYAKNTNEFRLLFGTKVLSFLMLNEPPEIAKSITIEILTDLIYNHLQASSLTQLAFELLTSLQSRIQAYPKKGITVDALLFSTQFLDSDTHISDTGDRASNFAAAGAEFSQEAIQSQEMVILNVFTRDFILNGEPVSEQVYYENEQLWHQVLNNPVWFVSPRGDKFHQLRDEQLAHFRIESVLFQIDKNYPREHRVKLKLQDIAQPFELWLDTERNLLNKDRQPPLMDPRLRAPLTHVLLQRLFVITSGMLATPQEEPLGHTDESKFITYKRAHYRLLTSTDNRPITMESHGAQLHAKEVKDIYGIDIYREIRRRRLIGTLAENEFITFVRETQPDELIGSPLPNELTFDPSYVHLP